MKKFLFFSVLALGTGIYFSHELSKAHGVIAGHIAHTKRTLGDLRAESQTTYTDTSSKVKEYRAKMEATQSMVRKAYQAATQNPNK